MFLMGEEIGAAKYFRYDDFFLKVIYWHNDNRVIGFTRGSAGRWLLVLASLNDAPFGSRVCDWHDSLRLPAGGWREVFNSDAAMYGEITGNGGATLPVSSGQIDAVIPAHGFVVFEKVS